MDIYIEIPQHVVNKLQLGVDLTRKALQEINMSPMMHGGIEISPLNVIVNIKDKVVNSNEYIYIKHIECIVKWNGYIIEMVASPLDAEPDNAFLKYKFTSPECIRGGNLYPSSIIEVSLNVTEIESSRKVITTIINKLNISN